MRYARILPKSILFFGVIFAYSFAFAEFNTIDELAAAYDDRTCRKCHEKTCDEWKQSLHSKSVLHSVGGLRNFIAFGLAKWKKPPDKENLMRCMHCHAPLLAEASEPLMKRVGDLVLSASEGSEEAGKELAKLNVTCVVCHNKKAVVEPNLRGQAREGVYYGPSGKATPAHGTERTPALGSAYFCSQCHWVYNPPDGDTLFCNTLYGSYEDAYRANGGMASCQDCHMREKGRGHSFPGAYVPEMVREGIGLDVQASGVRLAPQGTPTLYLNIGLANHAGHRVPDG